MPMHMARHLSIPEIEARLARHRISVAELCRRAAIAQSTWHKLKTSDRRPRESTCRVIESALAELLLEAAADPPMREAA
jgi:predicted transcriptional regulator